MITVMSDVEALEIKLKKRMFFFEGGKIDIH